MTIAEEFKRFCRARGVSEQDTSEVGQAIFKDTRFNFYSGALLMHKMMLQVRLIEAMRPGNEEAMDAITTEMKGWTEAVRKDEV